jgi:hypothetical protein
MAPLCGVTRYPNLFIIATTRAIRNVNPLNSFLAVRGADDTAVEEAVDEVGSEGGTAASIILINTRHMRHRSMLYPLAEARKREWVSRGSVKCKYARCILPFFTT